MPTKCIIMMTFVLQLSPLPNRRLFWRRIPSKQECFIDALPEPPATVNTNNILINDFTLNGTMLFLNMSWSPPPETYGEIQQYQVQVGAEPVTEEQSPTAHTAFSVSGQLINLISYNAVALSHCTMVTTFFAAHRMAKRQ